MTEFSSDGESI